MWEVKEDESGSIPDWHVPIILIEKARIIINVEICTFPIDVRILIIRILKAGAERMKSKVGDFKDEPAVHDAVARL